MHNKRRELPPKGRRPLFWDFAKQDKESALPKVRFSPGIPSEARLTEAESQEEHLRLLQAIRQDSSSPAKQGNFRWNRIAAVIALLLAACASVLMYWYATPSRVVTAYGETKEIWLPDSSRVTLNANSVITYHRHWQPGKPREVQLEGEAYFSVRKRATAAGPDRFVVHSGAWSVEVLGTTFNVLNRPEKKQVVLATGKVRLRTEDGSGVTMLPGDLVEQSISQKIMVKQVNAADFIAWKNQEIVFREVSLKEIAGKIRELYGVRVTIADSSRTGVVLTGTYPTNNLPILLNMIAGSAGMQVRQTGSEVIFY